MFKSEVAKLLKKFLVMTLLMQKKATITQNFLTIFLLVKLLTLLMRVLHTLQNTQVVTQNVLSLTTMQEQISLKKKLMQQQFM